MVTKITRKDASRRTVIRKWKFTRNPNQLAFNFEDMQTGKVVTLTLTRQDARKTISNIRSAFSQEAWKRIRKAS